MRVLKSIYRAADQHLNIAGNAHTRTHVATTQLTPSESNSYTYVSLAKPHLKSRQNLCSHSLTHVFAYERGIWYTPFARAGNEPIVFLQVRLAMLHVRKLTNYTPVLSSHSPSRSYMHNRAQR
jgi:hypothetical protein